MNHSFFFLHQHPLMRAHRKCEKFTINTTLISTDNCIVNHSLNVLTLFMIITSLYNKKKLNATHSMMTAFTAGLLFLDCTHLSFRQPSVQCSARFMLSF